MISIIIPARNEEQNLKILLPKLKKLKGKKEIIVVDGGSEDKTVSVAKKYGKVLSSQPPRATQMNAGALEATGDTLWFLHADTTIYAGALRDIEKRMKTAVGGGFYLAFSKKTFVSRLIAFRSNARIRFFKRIYGDQGMFVSRNTFFVMRGFKEIPIFEDLEFSTRLNKQGTVSIITRPLISSYRRFLENGPVYTYLCMGFVRLLYFLFIPARFIDRVYSFLLFRSS